MTLASFLLKAFFFFRRGWSCGRGCEHFICTTILTQTSFTSSPSSSTLLSSLASAPFQHPTTTSSLYLLDFPSPGSLPCRPFHPFLNLCLFISFQLPLSTFSPPPSLFLYLLRSPSILFFSLPCSFLIFCPYYILQFQLHHLISSFFLSLLNLP